MNGFEKFEYAMSLKPFEKKQDIPVFPHICTYAAVPAGVTQAKIFESNEAFLDAYDKTCKKVGYPDVAFPLGPLDVTFIEQMKCKIPGRELGENELFQFIEEPIMTMEDYDVVINKGFGKWQMPFVASIQNPPFTGPFKTFKVIGGFIRSGKSAKAAAKFWGEKGIPLMFHSGTAPAFDTFSLSRGLEEFFCDVFDEPEKVKLACEKATPAIIKTAIQNTPKGGRVAVFAMRSSGTFISTDMFEEFAWPYLKQMIEEFHKAGLTSVIHCDGDWLPMIPYFKEVPKASCILELDGSTDIEKAYEIIKGYQVLRGDIPATILAFGTAEETKAYCDKLINLAMGGGFIIGSGCEVPLNAKEENVKAFIECTK